jgi:hypothetical protein
LEIFSMRIMRANLKRGTKMDNFVEMARSHRKRYLPRLYSRLEKAGALGEHLKSVAQMAEEELLLLVSDQGMRHEEALEIVLSKYILISPEGAQPDPLGSSEEGIQTIGGTTE